MGILLLAPTIQGLRITHHCKIEQREAHAVISLMLYQYTLTQTFTVAFSLTMVIKSCEVLNRQRKTSVNVFLYACLAFYAIQTASNVRHCKSKIFLDWAEKNVGIYYFIQFLLGKTLTGNPCRAIPIY